MLLCTLKCCGLAAPQTKLCLLGGFPIVGQIAPTGRWPPYERPQKCVPVQDALDRAWEIRKKIIQRVEAVPVSENLIKIREATLEDVQEGSCLGPFSSARKVTDLLACDDWIPTQRFEVVQKSKVRGCDSATTNMINQVTVITEKLQLPVYRHERVGSEKTEDTCAECSAARMGA
jgi:hypothetical protein